MKPAARRTRLLYALYSLSALQVLNIVLFDDLRVDEGTSAMEAFTKPQHIAGIVAPLIAAYLVHTQHRWAARVSIIVAAGVALGFAWFHLVPTELGGMQPYWMEGDAGQWLGLILNCLCAGAVCVLARGLEPRTVRTPQAGAALD